MSRSSNLTQVCVYGKVSVGVVVVVYDAVLVVIRFTIKCEEVAIPPVGFRDLRLEALLSSWVSEQVIKLHSDQLLDSFGVEEEVVDWILYHLHSAVL